MKKILLIANYHKNLGGISGQVRLLNSNINNCDHYYSSVFNTKASFIKRILLLPKLIIVGYRYNVLHIHACSNKGFFPAILAVIAKIFILKKINLVLTFHGGDAENFLKKKSIITRIVLKKVNTIIVLSGFLKNVFEKFGYKVLIVPNIIEIKKSHRLKRKINPDFISLRSHTPLYNIDLIINSFHLFQKDYPEASLRILGDGILKSKLEKLVESLELKNVVFPGNVPNKEIHMHLKLTDILLSAPDIDNMPVSVLEGFALRNLVISSNVGGIPYMIKHKTNGLLFEKKSAKELKNLMQFAIENQELSLRIIENAYKSLSDYQWEKVKPQYFSIYDK